MTNTKNTVEIGDKFETKSLEIITKIIEEQQLGILANYIKIHKQKGYYSDIRNKNIKFDLTIEVWPPGANRYVLIYIIECKDYATRVPVGKIEEFYNKITQVSGVNVKGIFISNSPLQESAYNIAESKGMMVIQGESSNDYKIILHKINREVGAISIPFLTETREENLFDDGIKNIESLIDKTIINAFQASQDNQRVSYNIDRLSKQTIEEKANIELNKINPKILSDSSLIYPKTVIDYLQNSYELRVIYTIGNSNFLGSCDIKNNVISINQSIKGGNRELFIIGHELGHYLLHQKLSIGQNLYNLFDDTEHNFRIGKSDLKNPRHWIEWQANSFASSFILPKFIFTAQVWKYQKLMNRSKEKFYLDDQLININDFCALVNKLSYIFNVSKTSVIYKLKELNLLNDQSRLKLIKNIITEFKEELLI